VEIGQEPGRFWMLTPAEIAREMTATITRLVREQDDRAWTAWHIAALGRSKKLPKLHEMQSGKKPRRSPSRKQSSEIQLAQMKAIFLAFGGDPKELVKFNGR
jgi:hypothetical protein